MFEVHAVNYRRRRGNVLILFALMVFGLFAMAALVIDIGIARVTQRQMQTAVDSAALEGLRYRDQLPPITESELGQEDEARRGHAANVVRWMFNSSSPFDEVEPINFGATTTVEYTDGVGEPDKYALQKLNIRNIGKPTLLPNINNEARGDMVSGHYIPEPASDATSAAIQDFHKEGSDYSRDDFEPAVGASTKDDAFLVRMRRTGEVPDTGILSAGPPLPYLFAWGTTFPRIRTVENPQILADGIKVRATSIAQVYPAVAVGANHWNRQIPGYLDIAVSKVFWTNLLPHVEPTVIESGDFVDLPRTGMMTIGTLVDPSVASEQQFSDPIQGYVAIYDAFDSHRVFGFGYAEINPEPLRVKKFVRADRVIRVAVNASSRLSEAWDELRELPLAHRTELIRRNRQLLDDNKLHAILAPVSVR